MAMWIIGLLAILPVGIGLLKVWERVFPPEKLVQQVLEALRDKPVSVGFEISHRWIQGWNNTRALTIEYRLDLPSEVGRLNLVPEGAESAARAKVADEMVTGDQDFDDYFWVEAAPLEWLTPERRTVFLALFESFGPSHVQRGQLFGEVRVYQAPWTARMVAKKILAMQEVIKELAEPTGLYEAGPEGWVSLRRRGQISLALGMLAAVITAVCFPSVMGLWNDFSDGSYRDFVAAVFLSSVPPLLLCGLAILAGSRSALAFGKLSQVLLSLGGVAVIPLGVGDDIWETMGAVVGLSGLSFLFVFWLMENYDALTRFPFRGRRRPRRRTSA